MGPFEFICYSCRSISKLSEEFQCLRCGQPQSIQLRETPSTTLFENLPHSIWDYLSFLPIENEDHIVSLHEGATPLIQAERLADRIGVSEIWLKNESANPTGSFKDRQVSVGISHAREKGYDTVAAVSSGNVAASTAAYAARAGMQAILLMHGQAGATKIAQATAYGAKVIQVDSPKPSEVFDLCLAACREWGWYHLSTAGIYEPFNVEGSKTIAYEIYQQTVGNLPDWILCPVGGGGLLGGVWRGFLDLQRMGLVERVPRLVGVQATGCSPLVQAIQKGWSFKESRENPWPNPETIAGGIADDILFDGHTAIPAIKETGGMAVAVTDDEILEALHLLASTEGVLCELCSAVTVAALRKMNNPSDRYKVCCIITGSGIKDLSALPTGETRVEKIPCNLNELEKKI